MKNEIGRKLTSLTIMAIMFAGGLTVAAPSFMPGVFADFGETDGMLSVSSVYIQGGAILEVVVNDPDYSVTDADVPNGPSVDIDGTSYIMNQGSNGKWYVYAVDDSVSTLLDADGDGMEYGLQCTSGIGVHTGHGAEVHSNTAGTRGTANIIGDTDYDVWVEGVVSSATVTAQSGGCLGLNNMYATADDTAGTTSRSLMSAAVLQGAPSLSNWNGVVANSTLIDLGQRGHGLNASGYGSWPYILAFEFSDTNTVEYGSDSINVEFGNNGNTSISLLNQNPADEVNLSLSITDPGLNIDPTSADQWRFNIAADPTGANNGGGGHQIAYAANETDTNGDSNNWLSLAEMGDAGFTDNGRLNNSTGSAISIVDGLRDVLMKENDVNSGVFESWSGNGTSQLVTVDEVGGDKRVVFTYGGDSVDMVITYNNADLSMDAGSGDWVAGETAYVTVNDPDMNKFPQSTETLSIGDEDAIIPTIIMGTPLTLANSDGNNNLKAGAAFANTGVRVGTTTGLTIYTGQVNNTTDNSERLRITHATLADTSAADITGGSAVTHTWINVTTAHSITDIINLEGTPVLNYDISGPAGDLSSTAIEVYVLGTGKNSTGTGDITVTSTGNARAGVMDLDDTAQWVVNNDVRFGDTFGATAATGGTGATNVGVSFKISHAAGVYLNATADYAIAADFCNFDQDNGSSVHNCIYRIEAEETGDNTGIFEGSVSYTMLNNSTAADTDNGEAAGNDEEVEDLLTTNSDSVTVVLMNSSDDIRVVYNDTDALQAGDKLGAQVATLTHTGTASLDADTYGADDMATITIVDADLNMDSSIRDTYENSSRTFQMNVTKSDGVAQMPFATEANDNHRNNQ